MCCLAGKWLMCMALTICLKSLFLTLSLVIVPAAHRETSQFAGGQVFFQGFVHSQGSALRGQGATRGVMVSMSAFLACRQCCCAGSSLAWGLNLQAVVCGIF